MVYSVHGGKIVWCFLSTVAKLSGVHGGKNVVSFVHPGKNSLVSFGSGRGNEKLCFLFRSDKNSGCYGNL